MNTQSTFLNLLSSGLFATNAKQASAVASEYFTGWHYWFYFFSKAVKHT